MASKKIDLTGKKIGKLTVIREFRVPYTGIRKEKKSILMLECQCECGNSFFPYRSNVLSGYTKGCLRCARASNLVGKKIGKLLVLERFWANNSPSWSKLRYKIQCDCGNRFETKSSNLRMLQGKNCPRCRPKKKLKLSIKESTKKTNFKKHLIKRLELVGKTFGYLKCIHFERWEYTPSRRYPVYLLRCKCGNRIFRRGDRFPYILSCGCLQKEKVKRNRSRARLTDKDVKEIKDLINSGIYKMKEIAKIFKVDATLISNIKNGKAYKLE